METTFQKLEDFECPICFEIMDKEIYTCSNKHIHCGSCSKKLTTCPYCRAELEKKRHQKLETLRLKLLIQFNAEKNGEGTYDVCRLKDCRIISCCNNEEIREHIMSIHKNIKKMSSMSGNFQVRKQPSPYYFFLFTFGEIFIARLSCSRVTVKIVTRAENRRFIYCVADERKGVLSYQNNPIWNCWESIQLSFYEPFCRVQLREALF